MNVIKHFNQLMKFEENNKFKVFNMTNKKLNLKLDFRDGHVAS